MHRLLPYSNSTANSELAELHSMAVDFPKTGESKTLHQDISADLPGAIIPKRLRPRRWPEYLFLGY
jgi:RNA dependent RNA polymerase